MLLTFKMPFRFTSMIGVLFRGVKKGGRGNYIGVRGIRWGGIFFEDEVQGKELSSRGGRFHIPVLCAYVRICIVIYPSPVGGGIPCAGVILAGRADRRKGYLAPYALFKEL
jgi:hypothetical protein